MYIDIYSEQEYSGINSLSYIKDENISIETENLSSVHFPSSVPEEFKDFAN